MSGKFVALVLGQVSFLQQPRVTHHVRERLPYIMNQAADRLPNDAQTLVLAELIFGGLKFFESLFQLFFFVR